ncbi:MAG: PTS sugar transporter subunit IIA [Alphaproteobacteria bacterium]|nr:PTS sugar transporter subunit IIA [Alphaproteobacteria bacterium]
MGLTDLFSTDGAFLDLDLTSKSSLLHALSDEASRRLSRPREEIFEALQDRERLGPTALGRGVALPHTQLAEIDNPVAIFARLRRPIEFGAKDGESVDLVFLVLWPAKSPEGFLPALARICRALREDQTLRRLRLAKSPDEALAVLHQAEHQAASA